MRMLERLRGLGLTCGAYNGCADDDMSDDVEAVLGPVELVVDSEVRVNCAFTLAYDVKPF